MKREELFDRANLNYETWKEFYADEIKHSIDYSLIYDRWVMPEPEKSNVSPKIEVLDLTTQEATHKFYQEDPGILNFASYKHPGGGYLSGAWAQEESLCHSSVLYNVLEDFTEDEYVENCKDLCNGLYRNWAIFSPDIQFTEKWTNIPDKDKKFDVLTCPAPNLSAYGKPDEIYKTALKERIRFVLDIFNREEKSCIILGAFGCGVFGNNPLEVAEVFKEFLMSGRYSFKHVIFAIPGGENYKAFKKVYND